VFLLGVHRGAGKGRYLVRIARATTGHWTVGRLGAFLTGLLVVLLAAACTPGRDSGTTIAWREVPTPTTAPTVAPDPTAGPEATAAAGATTVAVPLGADDLLRIQPNELGRIPVLMYHAFTSDPAKVDEWTVTFDTFGEHLTWLYEHDFYLTPLMDLINNEISVPPGKHPVVLTFDDSTSWQFRLLPNEDGVLEPDPNTALGMIEAFAARHPDFGRTALFAVVPTACFHYLSEEATCEQRLAWLSNNGYEVANHTWTHENLHTVSDDQFRQEIGQTKIWIDERVRGESNLGNVLVLPFGAWPQSDAQADMLYNGFVHEGQDILITGVVEVGSGPGHSPSSGNWTRMSILRINTEEREWEKWTTQFTSGSLTFYVSDGDPATVTIPNQLADDLVDEWDPEWASAYGMEVIRYDLPEALADPTLGRGVLPNVGRSFRRLPPARSGWPGSR